jgi:SAM-dependent methyltransferase
MNFDAVRNLVYRQAIVDAVTPESVVLDLGAGLGLLGFIAAQAGARKVYLVEPEPVIEVTRNIARANGLNNVECIQSTAETLELPEKADLIISVLTGNFLLTEDLLPSLFHARDHFLAPGGRLLPDRGKMMVAPVSLADYYQENVGNWSLEQGSAHDVESYGIDYSAARTFTANTIYFDAADKFKAQLLAAPSCLLDMDFMTAAKAECDSAVEVTMSEEGECHGWLGWFEMHLGEQWLSTAPDAEPTHWRQVFLPLEKPLAVKAGQSLGFALQRREYSEWSWRTDFNGQQQRQSTFLSESFTTEILRKKSEDHRPELHDRGRAMQYLLSRFDGSASTGKLADALVEKFSSSFHSREEALRFVKSLVHRCS